MKEGHKAKDRKATEGNLKDWHCPRRPRISNTLIIPNLQQTIRVCLYIDMCVVCHICNVLVELFSVRI